MTNLKFTACTLVIAAAAVAAPAQRQESTDRLAKTDQIMSGMVHPNFLAIRDAMKGIRVDRAPWSKLATNAALLNEASFMIVENERSQGDDWDTAAGKLRVGAAAVYTKIKAKDINGLTLELKRLEASCTDCHAVHR